MATSCAISRPVPTASLHIFHSTQTTYESGFILLLSTNQNKKINPAGIKSKSFSAKKKDSMATAHEEMRRNEHEPGGAEARRETAREPPTRAAKRIEEAGAEEETERWDRAVPGRRPRSGRDVPDASAMVVGWGRVGRGSNKDDDDNGEREERSCG